MWRFLSVLVLLATALPAAASPRLAKLPPSAWGEGPQLSVTVRFGNQRLLALRSLTSESAAVADRFPDYDVLTKRDSQSWNDKTREVIDERLALQVRDGVLTPTQLATLRQVQAAAEDNAPLNEWLQRHGLGSAAQL